MKMLIMAAAMFCFVGSMAYAETAPGKSDSPGASQNAPGQKQKNPGDAKDFAPGQKQKNPGDAKNFAPGQKEKLPETTGKGGTRN